MLGIFNDAANNIRYQLNINKSHKTFYILLQWFALLKYGSCPKLSMREVSGDSIAKIHQAFLIHQFETQGLPRYQSALAFTVDVRCKFLATLRLSVIWQKVERMASRREVMEAEYFQ